MSLMVHVPLSEIYDMVSSKHFISKIFVLHDKHGVKKNDDGSKIVFTRIYNHKDLHSLNHVLEVPKNITNIIETNLSMINILFETTHEVIKKSDTSFIIKYTSILREPSYIYQILLDTKIILYAQFTVNKHDPNMTVIHFNKKLVNASDVDDDTLILNAESNDIITNIYQQDSLHINEHILHVTETFLGYKLVHEIILPTINTVFKTAFDVLQDIYILRFIKYVSKKGIEVYKKK